MSQDLRKAFSQFATGVTVITARGPDGAPVGMTVNSFTSLSPEPPLLLWCLGKSAGLRQVFEAAPGFCVNMLAEDQRGVALQFAAREVDRFQGIEYSAGPDGAPRLTGCLGWFDCDNDGRLDGGDHLIMIGRIAEHTIRDGDPLIFYDGKFLTLGAFEPAD